MQISVRSHNFEVSDSLKATVQEKVTRLTRFLDDMETAEVSFSEEKNPRIAEKEICEVTMHGHGLVVRAKASASEPMAAVDLVVDKLEHRIEKLKGKLLGRSHPRRSRNRVAGATPLNEGEILAEAPTTAKPRIVRAEPYDLKPMTAEEAVLQMDLLDQDFLFFTSAETSRGAVVYHREDGDIGLIESS